jgi:predicted Zn-dependent protease
VDPGEVHDISGTATAVADTLRAQADDFRQKTTSTTAAPSANDDPQAAEKLAALGYVASGNSVRKGVKYTGADPKDKIAVVNLLHNATQDIENARYKEAIPILETVLAEQPEMPIVNVQLGHALSWLHEYDKALPFLRKAAAARPDQLMTHYELALALFETGDIAGSIPEFQAAISKSPKWGALHFSLAAAYAKSDRMADAQKELQTTLELDPGNFRANLTLGGMLTMQGKPSAALPKLKKAVALQPGSPGPHLLLADAYERLGQKANAARERAEAERLKASGGQ